MHQRACLVVSVVALLAGCASADVTVTEDPAPPAASPDSTADAPAAESPEPALDLDQKNQMDMASALFSAAAEAEKDGNLDGADQLYQDSDTVYPDLGRRADEWTSKIFDCRDRIARERRKVQARNDAERKQIDSPDAIEATREMHQTWMAEHDPVLDSVAYDNATVRDIMAGLAQRVHVPIVVDPKIDMTLSVSYRNVRLHKVINRIAALADAKVSWSGTITLRPRKPDHS